MRGFLFSFVVFNSAIDFVLEQTPSANAEVEEFTNVDLVLSLGLLGDVNMDGVVDMNDILLIKTARNQSANDGVDRRDIDNSGTIDVNDARQAVLLCTLPRCVIAP